MADVGFFDAPANQGAGAADLMRQQEMAAALMRRGQAPQKGQMVDGHFVEPPTIGYAQQLAQALANGYKKNQALDAGRASDILGGGTGENFVSPLQKMGNWFGGGS